MRTETNPQRNALTAFLVDHFLRLHAMSMSGMAMGTAILPTALLSSKVSLPRGTKLPTKSPTTYSTVIGLTLSIQRHRLASSMMARGSPRR